MIQASINFLQVRLLRLTAFCLMALVCAVSASAATMRFDNGGGDNTWENPLNWDEAAAPNTLPGAADVADISDSHTVSISSVRTVSELHVAHPDSAASTTPGTATLNVLPGTNLQAGSSNGIRIGRKVKAGQMAGSSKGIVIQTGGLLQINTGTNGLRLSQADSGIVADSLYRISGGSVRGGSTAFTAPLQIGALANTFTSAEFHMVGSGVTEAHFEDVRMQGSTTGVSRLHFSLDAGGVTPLIAEDEMRFGYHTGATGSNNSLVIDLIGLAPMSNITLVTADRLTTNGVAGPEIFTGMPDGTPISATFGPPSQQYTYNWLLRYTDGGDNSVLDASVRLEFVSRTLSVPEPSSLVLLGLAGFAIAAGRRRAG